MTHIIGPSLLRRTHWKKKIPAARLLPRGEEEVHRGGPGGGRESVAGNGARGRGPGAKHGRGEGVRQMARHAEQAGRRPHYAHQHREAREPYGLGPQAAGPGYQQCRNAAG